MPAEKGDFKSKFLETWTDTIPTFGCITTFPKLPKYSAHLYATCLTVLSRLHLLNLYSLTDQGGDIQECQHDHASITGLKLTPVMPGCECRRLICSHQSKVQVEINRYSPCWKLRLQKGCLLVSVNEAGFGRHTFFRVPFLTLRLTSWTFSDATCPPTVSVPWSYRPSVW